MVCCSEMFEKNVLNLQILSCRLKELVQHWNIIAFFHCTTKFNHVFRKVFVLFFHEIGFLLKIIKWIVDA